MIRSDLQAIPSYTPGARNPDAVKLSSNESTHPPLPAAVEAMQQAAQGANRYPDMAAVDLKDALAKHLQLGSEQIAVGTGSSALCQQLVLATAKPGEEVIFPWRSFEAYPIFVQVVGATPVQIPLTGEHGVDLKAMADAVTDKTRLIFVCNPNNPTGSTVTRAEFEEFLDAVPQDVVIALDEAYYEYNNAADTPVATDYLDRPNIVGLRTFSKAYGLAGARMGYAFGNPLLIEAIDKVSIPFSASALAQSAAIASLQDQNELQKRVEETQEQRDVLEKELAAYGVPHSEANLIWVPAENIADQGIPQEIAERLTENGVVVRAFSEGIRITATTEEETQTFLKAWRKVVA
ncbi:MAG: histidinol-phosphate transaminase [Corynebacterium camporealensis]|uniref:histidinol-phosphate transaminase n=1 Tax=Corynebacterium camporealensis TaxID=161896 RepID=UPI002A91FB36|nr:histidinol-phosphate transaminase [Corynebacterium camporealensis]MDY5839758.1 histidinol-phosphate transaminase [Corynebacterium camporealensis]